MYLLSFPAGYIVLNLTKKLVIQDWILALSKIGLLRWCPVFQKWWKQNS